MLKHDCCTRTATSSKDTAKQPRVDHLPVWISSAREASLGARLTDYQGVKIGETRDISAMAQRDIPSGTQRDVHAKIRDGCGIK